MSFSIFCSGKGSGGSGGSGVLSVWKCAVDSGCGLPMMWGTDYFSLSIAFIQLRNLRHSGAWCLPCGTELVQQILS